MSYMPLRKSDVHETPDRVYDMIYQLFGLSKDDMFDPCPLNPDFDGLQIPWKKYNYVNPPYSHLPQFVDKAISEANANKCCSFMLLPSKTDQEWFHNIRSMGYQIIWIKGRLKFKNHKYHATQPHFLAKIA